MFGIRVRLLKKQERTDQSLPWAVEHGTVHGDRKRWTDTGIVSYHATEMEASRALCSMLKTTDGKDES